MHLLNYFEICEIFKVLEDKALFEYLFISYFDSYGLHVFSITDYDYPCKVSSKISLQVFDHMFVGAASAASAGYFVTARQVHAVKCDEGGRAVRQRDCFLRPWLPGDGADTFEDMPSLYRYLVTRKRYGCVVCRPDSTDAKMLIIAFD